jgi:ATP-dependent RNA helicase DeaD
MTKQALTLAKLPTSADILQHRENQVLEQMKIWLGRGRFQRERELVARLVEEGHDPMEIAAAALKLSRADEKQRPVANVTDVSVSESRSTPYRGDRDRGEQGRSKPQGRDGGRRSDRGDAGNKRVSHEAGMVRLKLNKGKENGVRPNDIVGTIAHHADIPGSSIGKIRIEDKFTYVDVPEDLVEKVLKHNGNYRIGKDKFTLVKS